MYSSLFINWPFRQTDHPLSRSYHEALCADIRQSAHYFKQPIESLYIGSKWAHTYPDQWLLDTSGTLVKTLNFQENVEFSLEIGGFSVSGEQAARWYKTGINRVILRYDEESAVQIDALKSAVHSMKPYIANLGIDLYTVVPGVLDTIIGLPLTHISLYTTKNFVANKKKLLQAGFVMYEWQHFAKPGFESVQAKNYSSRKSYRGFGVGACSFDGTVRRMNSSDVASYINGVHEKEHRFEYEELISESQHSLEIIMTGLRKPLGISKNLLSNETLQKMDGLIAQNYLVDHGETIGYTDRGFLVENQIITQII